MNTWSSSFPEKNIVYLSIVLRVKSNPCADRASKSDSTLICLWALTIYHRGLLSLYLNVLPCLFHISFCKVASSTREEFTSGGVNPYLLRLTQTVAHSLKLFILFFLLWIPTLKMKSQVNFACPEDIPYISFL